MWRVSHKFGAPHSPTGRAIVEHAQGTLKHAWVTQRRGMAGETPPSWLEKALCTISHLTVPQDSNNPVVVNNFALLQVSDGTRLPWAKVLVHDLTMNKWEGPHKLIVWGCMYACISTDTGVHWLPAKCVRPDLQHQKQNVVSAQPSNVDLHTNQQPDSPADVWTVLEFVRERFLDRQILLMY